MNQPIVFVSYSHKDEAEKEKLVSHLSVLDPAVISVWSDDALLAGEEWENAISKAISQASVAILLITANFLTSKFILQKEVKLLLERSKNAGMHVFPVIAKACAWSRVEWLQKMNVRPKNGTPIWSDGGIHVDEDLTRIALEIADIIDRDKDQTLAPSPTSEPVRVHDASVTAERSKAKASGGIKILIVDDEAPYRRSVIFGLAAMKMPILEAASVQEGIKLLEADKEIRIILLDLKFDGEESGKALLESIKTRSSYYRVIVLTAHTYELAAEEASAYHVFRYFAKGEIAPMQTLRFAVSNAVDDLKQHQEHETEDSIEKRFPTPFIYVYQHLKSDMSPLERLVSQKDMVELLLHFSGLVLLSEYLHSGVQDSDLDAQIQRRISRPALGDWLYLINEIANRKGYAKDTFFLDSFLEFFTNKNKKILNDFIAVRNKYVGHGIKHSDYEYGQVVERCDKWISALLDDYRFITRFLLCYVLSVQIIKGKYLYSLNECVTANPQLLKSTRPLNLMLDTLEMHLVDTEAEPLKGLSLSPFILLENCTDCRQTEIFFYSKRQNDQLHYVSYKTGHWFVREDLTPDFIAMTRLSE